MPLFLFEKILSEIRGRVRIVSLHVLGDPLCVANLHEYINIAKQYNINLDIVSSGVYLQREKFEILCSENIHQISFSLDSVYDKNNEKSLLKKYEKSNIHEAREQYFNMIYDFYSYLRAKNNNTFVNLRIFGNHDYSHILEVYKDYELDSKKRRIRLDYRFFLRFGKKFSWNNKGQIHRNSKPYCHASITQLSILSNGIVVPCCIDCDATMRLGDLQNQSFKEILDSKIFNDFNHSQMHCVNLPDKCLSCDFWGV